MMKHIPAQNVYICDCCGVECNAENWVQEGQFKINRHATDYQGHAVASADVSLDLCDSCLPILTKAVNEACEKIRAEKAVTNG